MPRLLTAGGALALAILLQIPLSLRAHAQKEDAPHPAELLVPDAGFELTAEQRARLEKYLPNAFAKLDAREPLHIVALGDSVTRYVSNDGHEGDTHRSYEGVFAAELAKLFFYTGGVRDIAPPRGQPAKLLPSEGPEITVQNLGLGGRVSLHGLGRATSDAFANKPSIMTMSFGINDAYASINIGTYIKAFETAAATARAAGCDVIFFGPTTVLDKGSELKRLALTQKYSSALRSLSERLGVFYFDLGSVTAAAKGIAAGQSDEAAVRDYNAYLKRVFHTHEGGEVDKLHPSAVAQRNVGRAVYEALLDGVPDRYRSGGIVTLDGAGGFTLEFKLKNLTEADLTGRVFPMPFDGFAPAVKSIVFETRAGKGQAIKVSYKSTSGDSIYRLDGAEPVLRVPLLVADNAETNTVGVAAAIHPFAPVWMFGTAGEVRNSVGGEFTVFAPAGSTAGAAGNFSAQWAGEASTGNFRAGSPTGFSFPLPTRADRKRGALEIQLSAGGTTLKFLRGLEVSRHMGLNAETALLRADRYLATGSSGGTSSREVSISATADATGITIVHDIALPLRQPAAAKAPYQVEIQLDARGYGKRRTFGFVDFIRFVPLDDGTVKISDLRPAVFGNGYNRALDRTQVKVIRERKPGGGERLSVTIPRSYFYLHEWALGNGNSLLGINSLVRVQSGSATADNPYPEDGVFSLVSPGSSRFNAESLGVLELTDRPTARWSTRVY